MQHIDFLILEVYDSREGRRHMERRNVQKKKLPAGIESFEEIRTEAMRFQNLLESDCLLQKPVPGCGGDLSAGLRRRE